jgi:hypothetical protein
MMMMMMILEMPRKWEAIIIIIRERQDPNFKS